VGKTIKNAQIKQHQFHGGIGPAVKIVGSPVGGMKANTRGKPSGRG
jgi:hypothetical protein